MILCSESQSNKDLAIDNPNHTIPLVMLGLCSMASEPPSESQCIRRVGTLLFHAVTIKHAPSTCNNSALSHSRSFPPDALHKGQLQTCCKLWLYAFGSCQMTQVALNTFKVEILPFVSTAVVRNASFRMQSCCRRVMYDLTIAKLVGIKTFMKTASASDSVPLKLQL